MSNTFGILQKDGTIKNLSKAEFDKYINARIMQKNDVKNLTNASGKFVDLADVVEVAIDDMYEDEFNNFISLTTLRKDEDGNVVFKLTANEMYQLATKVFEYVPKAEEWVTKWHNKNKGKDLAHMFADALEADIFEGAGNLEFLILYLTIFVYNGEVTEDKRIKIANWNEVVE